MHSKVEPQKVSKYNKLLKVERGLDVFIAIVSLVLTTVSFIRDEMNWSIATRLISGVVVILILLGRIVISSYKSYIEKNVHQMMLEREMMDLISNVNKKSCEQIMRGLTANTYKKRLEDQPFIYDNIHMMYSPHDQVEFLLSALREELANYLTISKDRISVDLIYQYPWDKNYNWRLISGGINDHKADDDNDKETNTNNLNIKEQFMNRKKHTFYKYLCKVSSGYKYIAELSALEAFPGPTDKDDNTGVKEQKKDKYFVEPTEKSDNAGVKKQKKDKPTEKSDNAGGGERTRIYFITNRDEEQATESKKGKKKKVEKTYGSSIGQYISLQNGTKKPMLDAILTIRTYGVRIDQKYQNDKQFESLFKNIVVEEFKILLEKELWQILIKHILNHKVNDKRILDPYTGKMSCEPWLPDDSHSSPPSN